MNAGGCPAGASPGDVLTPYALNITESVIFEGNDAELVGNIAWVTTGGLITPLDRCPNGTSDIVVATTPGLMRVGQQGQDNSSIEVIVRKLHMSDLAAIAIIYNKATLVLEDLKLNRIISHHQNCEQVAVSAHEGANFTATRTQWTTIINFGKTILGLIPNAAISGGPHAGDLTVEGSTFSSIGQAGAIWWWGAAGSIVNLVSSQGDNAGGIVVAGGSTTNIVNSLWSFQSYIGTPQEADRIINNASEDMNIIASTLTYPDLSCGTECQANGSLGWIYLENSGKINFEATAIGVNFPSSPAAGSPGSLLDAGSMGGSFSADVNTWIQATELQDEAMLKAVTNQASLLTGELGLPIHSFESHIQRATPLESTVTKTSIIIDVIDDASCTGTNKLVNPIDAACITEDVLGNPRVDGNDKRDTGAIQLSLAPHLQVQEVKSGQVMLTWSRPQDPASGVITGYAILYRELGSSAAQQRQDVIGEANFSATVTGLSNGVTYEFEVITVNAVGDGPASNQVTAVPLGAIATPIVTAHAKSSSVVVTWVQPVIAGHNINAYHISWKEPGAVTWLDSTYLYNLAQLKTTVSGLKNGVTYEFSVVAEATDKTVSHAGFAIATPHDNKTIRTSTKKGSLSGLLISALLMLGLARLKTGRWLSIMAALLLSQNLQADTNESLLKEDIGRYFVLQLGASYLTPDADEQQWSHSSEIKPALALGVGYQFTPQWSVDMNYYWLNNIEMTSTDGQRDQVDIHYSSFSVDAYYHFNWSFGEGFVPYVLLGFNHLWVDSSGDTQYVEEVENNQLTIGFGIDMYNNKNTKGSLEWRRLSEDAHFIGFRTQLLFR